MSSAHERTLTLDDGEKVVLERWGERGPAVLCVHGITSSRKSWQRFALRESGKFRVYAYDQRGHGDRAHTLGPMTLAQSVSDLRSVVTALDEPVDVLMGHSWGGAVALLGGLAYRPRRVVAIDPMIHVLPNTFERDYVDDLRELLETPDAERDARVEATFAGADPLDRAAKVHATHSMSLRAIENLGSDNRVDEGGWDLRSRLAGYPVPLLLALAGVESVVSAEDLEDLERVAGPNVRVRPFAGQGHNLHRTALDEFADAVERFVAET